MISRLSFYVRLILILGISLTMLSCKKPTAIQSSPAARRAFLVMGGLGGSQMNDVVALIKSNYPTSNLITFGGSEEWKIDIDSLGIVADNLTFIGHSYGTDTICKAKLKANKVILIDPVAVHGTAMTVPDGAIVYRRTFPVGPVRADLTGNYTLINISGSHNSIPHSEELLTSLKLNLAQ